ncbi:MAG: DNA-binding domain-containing protein, partial [Polyangiaceae bacterium]
MADRLSDVQARFFEVVAAPDKKPQRPLGDWIEGDATQRAGVYSNAYFARHHDVIMGDYPMVEALIGHEEFHPLVAEYLERHPPDNPSLRFVGARFAAFLSEHPLATRFPFLPDLARLEWARVDVFDVSDVTTLVPADLGTIPEDAWPGLVLELVPAFRSLNLDHPVQELWQAIHDETPVSVVGRAPTNVIVWRRDLIVYHRPVSGGEAAALALLATGAP